MNSPDPIAAQSLHVAQSTFDLTLAATFLAVLAVLFAGFALQTAMADARNNSKQLTIALRRPDLKVVFFDWPYVFGPVGLLEERPVIPRSLAVYNAGTRTSRHVRV